MVMDRVVLVPWGSSRDAIGVVKSIEIDGEGSGSKIGRGGDSVEVTLHGLELESVPRQWPQWPSPRALRAYPSRVSPPLSSSDPSTCSKQSPQHLASTSSYTTSTAPEEMVKAAKAAERRRQRQREKEGRTDSDDEDEGDDEDLFDESRVGANGWSGASSSPLSLTSS